MDLPGRRGMPSPEQMMACMATLADAFADVREQALAELHLGSGTRLLDAGCGAGELAIAVARRLQPGGRVVGVDLNADLIGRAVAAAADAGVEVDFRVGDIRDLPCADDEFEAVRCERVFQHLDRTDWPRAAAELIRATRPGGIIQLIDPDHLQSAIAATDAGLARLLVTDTVTLPPNPESGIHLPGLLRAAGAVEIHVEVRPMIVTSLATFRAMRSPDAVLTYLVQRHQVEADRAAAFVADLEARDREGSFLATSIVYVVSGRKAAD
jgi:ubiquinone/menaquinone biosynthesis C-methylase UbiE